MSNEVETHTEQAAEEDDDLFGQDEDKDGQEPKSTMEARRNEEDDEEDLFGQDEDGAKAKEDAAGNQQTSPKQSERSATNEEPVDSTHRESGNVTLDTAKLASPVSSPVPRKSVFSAPKVVVSVPRKNPAASPTPNNSQTLRTLESQSPAVKFNLPEAVIFPDTLDTALLEGRILETLRQLPANLCNDALQEYDDAIKQRKNIRSHGAYLFGVLKEVPISP